MTQPRESGTVYQIRVKGRLDKRWSDWFNGFVITYPSDDETLLDGRVADQAALHGLLAKIRDLGLSLLSIDRVERLEQPQLGMSGEESMDTRNTKPSAWYYGLSALILLLGCAIATTVLCFGARHLPTSIAKAYDLDRLTQIVVPGSADLVLSRTGAYAVYYERHSVVDGVQYLGSEMPPALECSLALQDTGREIPVIPDYVETNKYSTIGRNREGVLLMSTTVDEPGNYTFSCRYPDGEAEPKIVLAFGQNLFWEFMAVIIRTAGRIVGGLAVLGAAGAVAIVIAVVTAIKRRER